jgi:predicted nucleotidyltransferase
MLTESQIRNTISTIAPDYNIKSVSYFGSYASGCQTDDSDLDLLVEFKNPFVSLFTVANFMNRIQDALNVPVDVVNYPLPDDSYLIIDNAVTVYGQQRQSNPSETQK